jgi:hypothetical protein
MLADHAGFAPALQSGQGAVRLTNPKHIVAAFALWAPRRHQSGFR